MFLMGVAAMPRLDPSLVPDLAELPEPIHRQTAIGCPGCSFQMIHRIHDGIQIDLCPDCKAVWLDPGEIAHIASAYREKETNRRAELQRSTRRQDAADSSVNLALDGINLSANFALETIKGFARSLIN